MKRFMSLMLFPTFIFSCSGLNAKAETVNDFIKIENISEEIGKKTRKEQRQIFYTKIVETYGTTKEPVYFQEALRADNFWESNCEISMINHNGEEERPVKRVYDAYEKLRNDIQTDNELDSLSLVLGSVAALISLNFSALFTYAIAQNIHIKIGKK